MESSQALLNPRDEADQDGLRHTSNSVVMTRTLVQVQQDDCKEMCIGLVDKSGDITPRSPLTMADVAASALEEKQFSVTVKDRKPRFKEGVLAKVTPPFPNPKPRRMISRRKHIRTLSTTNSANLWRAKSLTFTWRFSRFGVQEQKL